MNLFELGGIALTLLIVAGATTLVLKRTKDMKANLPITDELVKNRD